MAAPALPTGGAVLAGTESGHAPARVARWSLVVLDAVVAVAAVFGGIGLYRDGMGMPDEWLDRTPFPDWRLPGLALLVLVAVPQLVAAVALAARARWAPGFALLMGAALVAWIVVQVAVLQQFHVMQPTIAAIGLVEALLARHVRRAEHASPA